VAAPASPGPGDGWSLTAAFGHDDVLRGRRVPSELFAGPRRSVALEGLDWKVVREFEPERVFAYRLDGDSAEQQPLPAPAELVKALDGWREAAARRGAMAGAVPVGAPTDALRERLRSLGYVK
jgi:hypothetical protein